ncbi:YheC/YheD family protein [Niallia sp. XMNu-256]|uniref:YheC/YheD family endospore coat-associated protein n=1 Tax=Niallia sp. XMNu-256 TaxID=3082444 RepID=UPI0030CB8D7C
MDSKISLIGDYTSENCVYIHPIMADRMNVKNGTGTIKFGTQTNTINIIISSNYNENELSISINVINKLKVPLFCLFDFINDQQNLMIGPFIGILAARTKGFLDVNTFSDYLHHYEQIGGAIMVFSLDEVSQKEQTIQGFVFNPINKQWKKDTYYYPSSLFLRIGWFGPNWQSHFESFMGDTIFNNFYYDKWRIYKRLKSSPELIKHLPDTQLYTKPSDILLFLEKYQSLYLKPLNSSRGQGIMKIEQLSKDRLLVHYLKGKKLIKTILNNQNEINYFFRQRVKSKKYLIQQTINLISQNKSIIDFRIYLTKDSTKTWKYITVFSRKGRQKQIVSNVSKGGMAGDGLQILKDTLHLDDHELSEIEESIQSVALKAVKAIERSGVHFANTAIDIGIDNNKKIWIIEIQYCAPGHSSLQRNKTIYYRYLNTIMQYAKKLAGF